MRIIAKLDIKQKDLIKSVMYDGVRKVGCPKKFSKFYYESNLDEIMLINNTGSLYDTKLDNFLIKEIRKNKAFPISGGGGVSKFSDAIKLIESGCDKIVINTLIHKNSNEARNLVNNFGSSSVIGAIQVDKINNEFVTLYEMARERTGLSLSDTIKKYLDLGIGEILITDVNRDGCYVGLNENFIEILSEFKNEAPLLISGGFNSCLEIDYFKEVFSGIVISSALHYKKVNLKNLITHKNKI